MNYAYLLCPICRQKLCAEGVSLVCPENHTFDISAGGYVNMNTRSSLAGDSAEMVRARSAFLDAGYYEPFADAVADAIGCTDGGLIVDAGCGEGYYSAKVADKYKNATIYGFDLSKNAVKKAAKRVGRDSLNASFFVCGIFDLPLASESVDTVINLFAPCAAEEFHRILKPHGRLIMGVSGEDHLLGLKKVLYDDVYLNRPEKLSAPDGFVCISKQNVRYRVKIDASDMIRNLFSMTPYYWRTSKEDEKKLYAQSELETVLDFDIMIFERSEEI